MHHRPYDFTRFLCTVVNQKLANLSALPWQEDWMNIILECQSDMAEITGFVDEIRHSELQELLPCIDFEKMARAIFDSKSALAL